MASETPEPNTAEQLPSANSTPSSVEATSATESANASPCSDANPGAAPDETTLINALKQVVDPELMINIVDLGLVYEVRQNGTQVEVDMTLTSPACPAGPQILQQSKMAIEALPGVTTALIKLVMNPPWSPDRMTDDARDQLGIF